MKTASWVIVDNITNNAVAETFNKQTAESIDKSDNYHAVPILEWLVSLNRQIKASD